MVPFPQCRPSEWNGEMTRAQPFSMETVFNIVMTTSDGGEKIKQGMGEQWKGSNQGWQFKPWQILSLSTSSSDFLLCPSSSIVSWIAAVVNLSINSPPGPLSRRCCFTNGVIQVWENELLAWWLLCVDRVIKIWHSTESKDPAGQLSPLSTEKWKEDC